MRHRTRRSSSPAIRSINKPPGAIEQDADPIVDTPTQTQIERVRDRSLAEAPNLTNRYWSERTGLSADATTTTQSRSYWTGATFRM